MEVKTAKAAEQEGLKTYNELHEAIVEVKANLETHMKGSLFHTPPVRRRSSRSLTTRKS